MIFRFTMREERFRISPEQANRDTAGLVRITR